MRPVVGPIETLSAHEDLGHSQAKLAKEKLLLAGLVLATVLVAPVFLQADTTATLDIYWIDVEGGAATLIVTPERESVLMDTGWPRSDERDAKRIQAAMSDAGISVIDYLLISHFHRDHVGGLAALSDRVSIGQIIDHGDSVEQGREAADALWRDYLAVAGTRRRSVAPGEKLALEGIELQFVASHRRLIDPVAELPENERCVSATSPRDDPGENGHSLGYLLSLGDFQFLNLGDLTPDREHALACPANRLGVVDLFQVPHHGGYGAIRSELLGALQPTAVVINNGPRKGGTPESLEVVQTTPGAGDVWQSHRVLAGNAAFNTEESLIANLNEEDDCAGHWIKATVESDGSSWTMTNGRTGDTRSYRSK